MSTYVHVLMKADIKFYDRHVYTLVSSCAMSDSLCTNKLTLPFISQSKLCFFGGDIVHVEIPKLSLSLKHI